MSTNQKSNLSMETIVLIIIMLVVFSIVAFYFSGSFTNNTNAIYDLGSTAIPGQ